MSTEALTRDGRVLEVWDDGDTFTALVAREGQPELMAEFSMRQCGITAGEGDLIIVTPERVTKRELRAWTAAEIAEFMQRARRRSRMLRRNVDWPDPVSTEALTRETRYEGLWRLAAIDSETQDWELAGGLDVVRCKSCGSLVAEGSEDLHETLHQEA
jgi:hypothetical protein